jgi:uncharacterized membrane protein YjfL (UPF0719 family)
MIKRAFPILLGRGRSGRPGLCLIVIFFLFASSALASAQKFEPPRAQKANAAAAVSPSAEQLEKIVPAYKNIKEKTAVIVFLFWLWAAIIVLIVILRLETREADRVHRLAFRP